MPSSQRFQILRMLIRRSSFLRHHQIAAMSSGVAIAGILLAVFGVRGNWSDESLAKANSPDHVSAPRVNDSRSQNSEKFASAVISKQQATDELPSNSNHMPVDRDRSKTASADASSILDLSHDECCRLLQGEWNLEMSGKRWLTVRPDQTATLIVEPNAVGRLLFGEKITFEFEWSIAEGHASFHVVGGMPEDKVKLAATMWGDDWRQAILALDGDRAVLLDADGTTKYEWQRSDPSTKP